MSINPRFHGKSCIENDGEQLLDSNFTIENCYDAARARNCAYMKASKYQPSKACFCCTEGTSPYHKIGVDDDDYDIYQVYRKYIENPPDDYTYEMEDVANPISMYNMDDTVRNGFVTNFNLGDEVFYEADIISQRTPTYKEEKGGCKSAHNL